MNSRDERVLELAQYAFQMSRNLPTLVDVQKRYQFNDSDDPHARLIEFVHREGSLIWSRS